MKLKQLLVHYRVTSSLSNYQASENGKYLKTAVIPYTNKVENLHFKPILNDNFDLTSVPYSQVLNCLLYYVFEFVLTEPKYFS